MLELSKDVKILTSNIKELKIKKTKIIIIIALIILTNIVALVNPLIFGNIMDSIINKSIYSIKKNILIMSILFIFNLILNYLYSKMIFNLNNKIEIDIKAKVFNSILHMPFTYYENLNKGQLINNLEYDSGAFVKFISNNLNLIIDLLTMILSLIFMIIINPYLTLILFITFPIAGIIHYIIGKKVKVTQKIYKDKYDNYMTFINETIYGKKFLQLFNAEKKREKKFFVIIKDIKKTELKQFNFKLKSSLILSLTSYIINTSTILLGIMFIFKGNFTIGMLISFNSYADTFKSCSLSLAQLNSIVQEASVSLSRINSLTNKVANKKIEKNNDILKDQKINKLKINNLCYKTSENNLIFDKINIEFKVNNIYVLKGESGSGKTTLFNILCKFITNYSGQILINDINLKCIENEILRNKVCHITQENFLYSISIYENIALYRDVKIEKVIEICKKINIHNIIMKLPKQYDTIINEYGINLSGGEKQRICIARAMIDKPDVYLFDEITSAIDYENTKEVLKIIEILSENTIVIINSHDKLEFSKNTTEYCLKNKEINLIK